MIQLVALLLLLLDTTNTTGTFNVYPNAHHYDSISYGWYGFYQTSVSADANSGLINITKISSNNIQGIFNLNCIDIYTHAIYSITDGQFNLPLQ